MDYNNSDTNKWKITSSYEPHTSLNLKVDLAVKSQSFQVPKLSMLVVSSTFRKTTRQDIKMSKKSCSAKFNTQGWNLF